MLVWEKDSNFGTLICFHNSTAHNPLIVFCLRQGAVLEGWMP
jgi:hypothetical protein